jgi:4'-phosphopantetheinyl transferase
VAHVEVWLIRTDLPAAVIDGLARALDDAERDRVDTLTEPSDRRRFTAAHAAARLIAADRIGVAPSALRWGRGADGKPHLVGTGSDLQTNLSHSEDVAVLAVTRGHAVGVDVQWLAPDLDALRLSERFFRPAEARFVSAAAGSARLRRFVDLWTRKEACVKAWGGRLGPGLRLPVHGRVVRDPGGVIPGEFRLRGVPVPVGFRAAVALHGDAPFTLAVHHWSPPNGGVSPSAGGSPA